MVTQLLSVVRGPDGYHHSYFFQKHSFAEILPAIKHVEINDGRKAQTVLYITGLAGLLSLVQFGGLEMRIWGARIDRSGRPDRLAFDFDLDPKLLWQHVVTAVVQLRELFAKRDLQCFVKTRGDTACTSLYRFLAGVRGRKWVTFDNRSRQRSCSNFYD